MQHSPIAHNFYMLRRLLVETLGLPRHAIRPSSTFADLAPPADRQKLWLLLEQAGMRDPSLSLPPDVRSMVLLAVLAWATGVALATMSWLAGLIALVDAGYLAYRGTRRWANYVNPQSMTIGEAAICMTSTEACRRAGYRLSERDIFVKVRLIVWQASGAPYEAIVPESRLLDLID